MQCSGLLPDTPVRFCLLNRPWHFSLYPGVYLFMNNLLLETNQAHSRRLFFGCLLIALVLVPLVLKLVDRSMSALQPKHTHAQPSQDTNSSTWDLRSR